MLTWPNTSARSSSARPFLPRLDLLESGPLVTLFPNKHLNKGTTVTKSYPTPPTEPKPIYIADNDLLDPDHLSLSPCGTKVFVNFKTKGCFLVDLENGKKMELHSYRRHVELVSWSDDGNRLLVCSNGHFSQWTITKHKSRIKRLMRNVEGIKEDWHKKAEQGKTYYLPGTKNTFIYAWKQSVVISNKFVDDHFMKRHEHTGFLIDFAISPNGEIAASYDEYDQIHIWYTTTPRGTNRRVETVSGRSRDVTTKLHWSPDGKHLIASSAFMIKIIHLDKPDSEASTFRTHWTPIGFTPDSEQIVLQDGNIIRLLNWKTEKETLLTTTERHPHFVQTDQSCQRLLLDSRPRDIVEDLRKRWCVMDYGAPHFGIQTSPQPTTLEKMFVC